VRTATGSVGLAATAASALFGLLLLVQYLAARRLDRGALRAGEKASADSQSPPKSTYSASMRSSFSRASCS